MHVALQMKSHEDKKDDTKNPVEMKKTIMSSLNGIWRLSFFPPRREETKRGTAVMTDETTRVMNKTC